jgi:hypothetical protein
VAGAGRSGGRPAAAGWPDQDGVVHDGIGYALLREDWEQGKTTPVDWDGE